MNSSRAIHYISVTSCLFCLLVNLATATAEPSEEDDQLQNFKQPYYRFDEPMVERRSLLDTGSSLDDQFERRTGGRGTQVAISLERVKNPDDHPSAYKKKKFPITWLRDQYPFNSYYKKKRKPGYGKQSKYPNTEPLMGQYSSANVDVLDPNPSTWVRIPGKPTASIKIQKQQGSYGFIPAPQIQIPESLQFAGSQELLFPAPSMMTSPLMPLADVAGFPIQQQAMPDRQVAPLAPLRPAGQELGGMMVSESQSEYSSSGGYQKQEPQSGFGGISLSFGNGRSISFGGGQGLTIGGRAGAISIGGKGADNQPSASGYSEAKGGRPPQQQASYSSGNGGGSSTASSESNNAAGYNDNYASKYPSMSVDVPRKGKTIVHANLDMAPIKFRLHSSPRVKVTTGSRDPLEKPSDEELAENEEDIFEPPEPFVKQNATATNVTSETATNTTNNGDENAITLSPMQLQQQQQNIKYPQQFNQQLAFANQQPGFNSQYPQQVPTYGNGLPRPAHQPYQNDHRLQYNFQQQQGQQYSNAQVPFDEPPQFVPQQSQPFNPGQYLPQLQPQPQPQQQQQFGANEAQMGPLQPQLPSPPHYPPPVQMGGPPQLPPLEPIQMNPNSQQQLPPTPPPPPGANMQQQLAQPNFSPALEDQRPAVNQWRQFSREARQQLNQLVPKQEVLNNNEDNNPRFYNGGLSPNSIAEPQLPNRPGPPGEPRDTVDFAASGNVGSYARVSGGVKATNALPQHAQFNPSTVYQVATPLDQPKAYLQPTVGQSSGSHQNYQAGVVRHSPANQQQVQPQESSYHSSSQSYNRVSAHSSYSAAHQDGTRTYTFGNGGFSTQYGSSGSSGSGGNAGNGASSSGSSDGFDQKNYAAKVEKFDPDAHDKRERSKVIFFLRPRISIHSANSSTTTKRPKNQQRTVYVINRPIFLNTTNATHHDDDFLDPDLREPMQLGYGYGQNGYGYGYGYGYSRSYSAKPTSSTTRKPKTTTTTTTTSTTTVAADAESTTSSSTSSSETEKSTTSGEDSSSSPSTTESSTSSSTDASSTTSTESPASSSEASSTSSSPSSTSSTSPSSSSSTTDDDFSESPASSERPTEASSGVKGSSAVSSMTEPSSTGASTSESSSNSSDSSQLEFEKESSSEAPEKEANDGSVSSSTDDSAADLIAAATEPSRTTTTARALSLSRTTNSAITSTSTSTSTSTTLAPTTSTQRPTTETAESAETTPAPESTTQRAAPTTTVLASSTDDSEFIVESQNQAKRSVKPEPRPPGQAQPMLLTSELIDKLMSNKTLVNLMSSQLKRVIDTEQMGNDEKERIVRQVFDQMMDEKVDFSMNNVRLAVKTVSSSYRAAAEKQRKKASATGSKVAVSPKTKGKGSRNEARTRDSGPKGFGRRASVPDSSRSGDSPRDNGQPTPTTTATTSKVIDTAIKLTKTASTSSKSNGRNRKRASSTGERKSSASASKDAAGNPIVVVLLPQEKA